MIQVIVTAHGALAHALTQTLTLIAGAQAHVMAITLPEEDEPAAFEHLLARALDAHNGPALVLCDLRGGTPHNVAVRLGAQRPRVRVLSGASLPMLLEAALSNERDIDALTRQVRAAALLDLQG